MLISKENINLIKNSKEPRLCNDLLFNGIISKLEKIDFSRLNNEESKWVSSNQQGGIGNEYEIVLKAKNDFCIPITFLLWEFTGNIYIGKQEYHFADDATVRNEKEYQEYFKYLHYLFDYNIKETIFYRKNKVVGYDYEFINNGNTVHRIAHNKLFKLFYDEKIINQYNSWIE
jgi:hypothetical protein